MRGRCERTLQLPPHYTIAEEGRAQIIIPRLELYRRPDGVEEPAWAPVFYNPRMVFNRDLSVLTLAAYSETLSPKPVVRVADLLSATGVRAIRYSLEVPRVEKAFAVDRDEEAYRIIRENIRLNNLEDKIVPLKDDANLAALRLKYEYIEPILFTDVDPYGSPAPFLENALRLIGHRGMIAMTATDLAPLTGGRPKVAWRRYFAKLKRGIDGRELGIRTLIAIAARKAAMLEKAVKPILSYYADHYIRVYLLVERGASKADRAMENIGMLYADPYTGYSTTGDLGETPVNPVSGKRLTPVGPLWVSSIGDPELVADMKELLRKTYSYLETRNRIQTLISTLEYEYKIEKPPISVPILGRVLGGQIPPINMLVEELKNLGYMAVRSHIDPQLIRTNAPFREVVDVAATVLHYRSHRASA